MTDTTPVGLPYADPPDPFANFDLYLKALAEAVDERMAAAGLQRPVAAGTQAIGSGVWTVVDLTASLFESHAGMVDLATNRIIVPTDGVYAITGNVMWTGAAPSFVYATIQKFAGNVAGEGAGDTNPWSGGMGGMPAGLDTAHISVHRSVALDAGDGLDLEVIANGAFDVISADLTVARVY